MSQIKLCQFRLQIKQYKKLFKIDGIALDFEEDAFEYIVDKAIEFKLGARGLRSICETIMVDAMFDAPNSKSKEFVITKEYAKKKLDVFNQGLKKVA